MTVLYAPPPPSGYSPPAPSSPLPDPPLIQGQPDGSAVVYPMYYPQLWGAGYNVPGGWDDATQINQALAQYPVVRLVNASYQTASPVVVPPYKCLQGSLNTTQVSQTDGGTTLAPTSAFTGITINDGGPKTLTAAIVLLGQAFGGYSTAAEEIKIRNIQVDGSAAPAGVQGILSYGAVSRVYLSEVLFSKVTGDGVQHNLDVAGNQPDAWYGYKVFSRFNGGKGFSLRSADSTWQLCLGSNNGDASCDWFINTTANSKYIGCRSEHSVSGLGFGYVCTNSASASGGVLFLGCSTDQSNLHGFQAGGTINGIASFVHAVALTFAGCVFRRDGANGGAGGGNYAGLFINGYGGQVTIAGLTIWPGVNDNGTGANAPQFGLSVVSSSRVNIAGAYIQGATTAINDDGTNTINYDNSAVTAIGTTGNPTITASPNIAAYQGQSIVITPPAAPASDPVQIVNVNSGERAFGIRVSGLGAFDTLKMDSAGTISGGPGNATQDWFLGRQAAGILQVTSADFDIATAGKGLRVKEGSNAKQGTAVLVAGTVTVPDTAVTANSRIFLTSQADGGAPGFLRVSSRAAGTSFTITSSSATDTSTVAYEIFEPG